MEERPAFLMYAAAWLASTRGLTLEQKGAYIDLLCHAWLEEGLPVDEDELRRIAAVENSAWPRIWGKLKHKWHGARGRLFNRKLEHVREETAGYAESARIMGKASAAARKVKYGTAQPRPNVRTNVRPSVRPSVRPNAAEPSSFGSVDHEKKGQLLIGGPRPVRAAGFVRASEVMDRLLNATGMGTRQAEVADTDELTNPTTTKAGQS